MKRVLLLLLLSIPLVASAQTRPGKIARTPQEPNVSSGQAVIGYGRDCFGNGKPSDMAAQITKTASGVGYLTTIVELDGASGVAGTNRYTTTIDTSVANTINTSCATWSTP